MFQKVVLPIIIVLYTHYAQAADSFPLSITWKHKGIQYGQQIKDVKTTTTIKGLKALINKKLFGITIPIEAQRLYSEELKSIFWYFPCKKIYKAPLLKDNATCKDYGISSETLINVEYDFVTKAALQGCKLRKEERKTTSKNEQPSILQIPAQQLLAAVPEAEEHALSTDATQNP